MIRVIAGLTLMLEDPEFPVISGAQDGVDGMPADSGDSGTTTDWTFPSDPGGLTAPPPVDPGGLDPAPPTPDMTSAANPTLAADLSQLSPADQQLLAFAEGQGQDPTQALATVQANQQYQSAQQTAGQNIIQSISAAGYDPNHVRYDTATGNLYLLNADGSVGQPLAFMQNGQYVPAVPNPNAPGQFMADPNGATSGGTGFWGSLNSALGPLSSFLATPAGKLLGALGVGGAATGLGALLTQNRARVSNAAATTPNAGTIEQLLGTGQGAALAGLQGGGAAGLAKTTAVGLQGTGTLADLLNLQANQGLNAQAQEQPLEQAVGMNAVGQLPGQMNATTNPNITGTAALGQQENTLAQGQVGTQGKIMTGIGQQVQNVLNGQYSNPILENQIKLSRDAFNAKMYAQLGPGWETSTPGIQAKQQQDLLESSQRFQDQQSTLANYTPLYSGMLQSATGNQSQATGQVQQAQAQGVGQNLTLSQLGKQNPSQLTANLNTLAPPTAYAGLNSAAQSQSQLMQNQQQANLVNTANQNAANNSLAQGIGQVGGIAAAGLMGTSAPRSLLSTGGVG